MTIIEFLKPRLVGVRFAEHAIPLEFLQDLAVLQEMMVEIAKWRFLEANSDRSRAPKGFADGISLCLTGIEDGSARPVISLVLTAGLLFAPYQTFFEEARGSFVAAIAAAERNESAVEHLPEKILSYFDRFGRNLREGEAVEFSHADELPPTRLTKENRRKLVLASTKVQELTETVSIYGAVPEIDQDRMSFTLQLRDGRRLNAPMPTPLLDTILEAVTCYRDGTLLAVDGIAKLNRSERLVSLEFVEHASILDALDITVRIDEFKTLRDGWLEGGGFAPSHKELDWFAYEFQKIYPDSIPLPYLYPTPDGNITAEWTIGQNEVSIEINLREKTGVWHLLHLGTLEAEEEEVNLDTEEGWRRIACNIAGILGDTQ